LLLLHVKTGEAEASLQILRLQFERLVEVLHRLVGLVLLDVGDAATDVVVIESSASSSALRLPPCTDGSPRRRSGCECGIARIFVGRAASAEEAEQRLARRRGSGPGGGARLARSTPSLMKNKSRRIHPLPLWSTGRSL
jgi:hypothetical protein